MAPLVPKIIRKKPTDEWSVREKLALAAAVLRCGDNNWASVSRLIRPLGESTRPADWFSQKNAALQYSELLENLEIPKRKRGERLDNSDTPANLIARKLRIQRIGELQKLIQDDEKKYREKNEILQKLLAGHLDSQIPLLLEQVKEEERLKKEAELNHKQWLKEREMKLSFYTKGIPGNKEVADEPTPPLTVEVQQQNEETTASESSPLLTSLLKSPVPKEVPNQSSNQLSFFTPPPNVVRQLPTEENTAPPTSISVEAPTLSKLLETPPPEPPPPPLEEKIPVEEVNSTVEEVFVEDVTEVEVKKEEEFIQPLPSPKPIEVKISEPEQEPPHIPTPPPQPEELPSSPPVREESITEEVTASIDTSNTTHDEVPVCNDSLTPQTQIEEKLDSPNPQDTLSSDITEENTKQASEFSETTAPSSPDTKIEIAITEEEISPADPKLEQKEQSPEPTEDKVALTKVSEGQKAASRSKKGIGSSRRRGRPPKLSESDEKVLESLPNSPAYGEDPEATKEYKTWKKAIMLVWNAAANHKFANTFLHPVTEDVAPGYHNIVARPMDLVVIKKNIETGLVRTTLEVERDMLLMFNNAIMYNSSDHDVYRMAVEMQAEVLEHIRNFKATQLMLQSSDTKVLRGRKTEEEEGTKRKRASHLSDEPSKKRRSRIDN